MILRAITFTFVMLGYLVFSNTALAEASPDTAALSASTLARGFAASAFTSPVAFGSRWGSVGIGGVKTNENGDGSLSAAVGLGDPSDWIGLDVATVFSSLSSSRNSSEGFGDAGSFAIKLHRDLGNYTSIAIGGSGLGRWSDNPSFYANNPEGYYLALSKGLFLGNHVLMVSAGAGKNVTNKNGNSEDVFMALSFYFTHWLSIIAEYDGYCGNSALSLAPFPSVLPLTITVGYVDLFEKHNETPRLNVTAGIGYHF